MSRRRAGWAAVGLAMIIGCGGGDRLKPGTEVLATSGTNLDVIGFESPMSKGRFAPDVATIANGTKIRVVSDAEPDDPKQPGERAIQVLVLEGEQKDIPGKVKRREVSPAR